MVCYVCWILILVECEDMDCSPDSIYVCYPFTRQFLKLPDPFTPAISGAFWLFFLISLSGSDLVLILMNGWGDVRVFTLGDTSWRDMGNTPCLVSSLLSPKHAIVNGALHWYSQIPVNSIVAFDIADENVQIVDPPNIGEYFSLGVECFSLGVLSECLSVSGFVYGGNAEIWIMKDYGVKKSWNKCYDINFSEVGCNYGYIGIVCLQRNGELVLLYGHGEIVLYNSSTLNLRKSNIVGPSPWFEAMTHVPSLVSPLNCRRNIR